MSIDTPSVPAPSGDFASGERTEALTPEESQQEGLRGDFAAGERTEPLTAQETTDEGLHGDFAAGERSEPVTLADETPGTFGDAAQ